MKVMPQSQAVAATAKWTITTCLLLLCAILVFNLPTTTPGEGWYTSPAFFPLATMALVAMGALSYLFIRRQSKTSDAEGTDASEDEVDASASDPRLAIMGIAGVVLYMGLIVLIGFALATLLFVVAGAWLCGLSQRQAWRVGAVLAAALYGVFVVLFKVSLPQPLLLQWLGGGLA